MKRMAMVLILLAMAAGCQSKPAFAPRPDKSASYLEGFMDGYHSAHPDQPYSESKDSQAYNYPNEYRSGWTDGYRVGRQEVRQRE